MAAVAESFAIHFFGPLTVPIDHEHHRAMRWGEVLEVTPERYTLSLDRLGRSYLDLLDDEEGQIARWGRVMFARGEWPEHLPLYEPGSIEADEARETARQAAHAIADPELRKEALRQVKRKFGAPTPTSRTIVDVS